MNETNNDEMEAVLQELAEEAMMTGGGVIMSPCSCRRCNPTCPNSCDDCLREAYEADPCFRD